MTNAIKCDNLKQKTTSKLGAEGLRNHPSASQMPKVKIKERGDFMTMKDIERFKNKFKVGDMVVIPGDLVHLTHESYESQIAEVVGLYRNFFNVKYLDLPYEQSIQYKDGGHINKVTIGGIAV